MAEYDGLPLNTPTKVRATADYEVWATRTANGGHVEFRPIGTAAVLDANARSLVTKAQAALTTNAAYLGLSNPTAANTTYIGSAALPAGTALTTTQLTTIVRALDTQLRAVTQQNNALIAETIALAKQVDALILLALQKFDDVSNT